MYLHWNDRTMRWMKEASDYSGYTEKLTKILSPYIPDGARLCDVGCGMGMADLLLAPRLRHITCIDRMAEPLVWLDARCREEGINNITTRQGDILELEQTADIFMLLFCGAPETTLKRCLGLARDRVIFVTHDVAAMTGHVNPMKKCCDVDRTDAWLRNNGYSRELLRTGIEFGQPHRSMEEALAFQRTYTEGLTEQELIRQTEESVRPTGDSSFPFYTPKIRHMGIFVINPTKHGA